MEQGKDRVIVKVYDGLDLVFKKEYDNKSCEGALMRLELDAGIKANFKKIRKRKLAFECEQVFYWEVIGEHDAGSYRVVMEKSG